ncbi:MAG: ParA family protein [Deltaproteobacteria bacterium]|nr:ParA family protein [Deltaproteobacteria bacterium]
METKKSASPSIITIATQKGGVGKTSLTVNLAEGFASLDKKVLVLDLDYQGDASDWFGAADAIEDSRRSTTWGLVKGKKIPDLRVSTNIPNVDVIGSDLSLNYAIQKYNGQQEQFNVVKRILECKEKDEYDIILIDTHPSLDPLLTSALNYSHYYLVPMFPEKHPFKGLEYLMRIVASVKSTQNPMLFFLGVVITKYKKKSKSHNDYLEVIKEHTRDSGIELIEPFIRDTDAMASAAGAQTPIGRYFSDLPVKSKDNADSDYKKLAENLLTHLKGRRMGRPQKVLDPARIKVMNEKARGDEFADSFGSFCF